MVTTEELVYKLRNNSRFLMEVVIYNNPQAVLEKLEKHADFLSDGEIDDAEKIKNIVSQLIDEGENEAVDDILTVPFNRSDATDKLQEAYNFLIVQRGKSKTNGKFLDTDGSLYLLASAEYSAPSPKTQNQPLKQVKVFGATITFTKKDLIIFGLALALAIAYFSNKNNK